MARSVRSAWEWRACSRRAESAHPKPADPPALHRDAGDAVVVPGVHDERHLEAQRSDGVGAGHRDLDRRRAVRYDPHGKPHGVAGEGRAARAWSARADTRRTRRARSYPLNPPPSTSSSARWRAPTQAAAVSGAVASPWVSSRVPAGRSSVSPSVGTGSDSRSKIARVVRGDGERSEKDGEPDLHQHRVGTPGAAGHPGVEVARQAAPLLTTAWPTESSRTPTRTPRLARARAARGSRYDGRAPPPGTRPSHHGPPPRAPPRSSPAPPSRATRRTGCHSAAAAPRTGPAEVNAPSPEHQHGQTHASEQAYGPAMRLYRCRTSALHLARLSARPPRQQRGAGPQRRLIEQRGQRPWRHAPSSSSRSGKPRAEEPPGARRQASQATTSAASD